MFVFQAIKTAASQSSQKAQFDGYWARSISITPRFPPSRLDDDVGNISGPAKGTTYDKYYVNKKYTKTDGFNVIVPGKTESFLPQELVSNPSQSDYWLRELKALSKDPGKAKGESITSLVRKFALTTGDVAMTNAIVNDIMKCVPLAKYGAFGETEEQIAKHLTPAQLVKIFEAYTKMN